MTKSTQLSPSEPGPSSIQSIDFGKARVRFAASIEDLDRASWQHCFAHEIEDFDYHISVEKADLNGFKFGWYVVEVDKRIVAAAPAFVTAYDLATTAQGLTQRILKALQTFVPGKLTLNLSCLGSPVTEVCPLGLDPELDEAQSHEVFGKILRFWVTHALSCGVKLTGIKDLSETARARFAAVLVSHGLRTVSSLPTAILPIEFESEEAYLAGLSRATRKDMRRKLKGRSQVRIELSRDINPNLKDIMAMYAETRSRSDWAFEELTPAYFREVITRLPDKAMMALYYSGSRLIGANLLLFDKTRLLDKFFVMRSREGRQFDLYFLSWFHNVQMCLDRKIPVYQSGQEGYETKMRLGSELEKNWICYRHANPLVNGLLRAVSPLLAVGQPVEAPPRKTAAKS